ncbi:hypothetical protein PPL_08767 [Heterostelium album PN500]|uniref:Uncharacterized protein n=1 Tax=Heterostelium pallidum (strain ATCC 26659 / Pp 5 / PN500) TaxID=670386 RepID=D3BJN9_HETP5|nr:hypothetical protein PPL_08767 [Heterostelium album PN500]EFA78119.1 hypothetical protein PPL_08767 [Heterostelium album PN500]|eukprot:XP_020430245.1 hypothetical protein PPL_08767 [Heterostelium album PN500]
MDQDYDTGKDVYVKTNNSTNHEFTSYIKNFKEWSEGEKEIDRWIGTLGFDQSIMRLTNVHIRFDRLDIHNVKFINNTESTLTNTYSNTTKQIPLSEIIEVKAERVLFIFTKAVYIRTKNVGTKVFKINSLSHSAEKIAEQINHQIQLSRNNNQ